MSADVCIYCAATGCVSGTAQHGTDCPFMTGLWPITEEDISRETVCAACDEPFAGPFPDDREHCCHDEAAS